MQGIEWSYSQSYKDGKKGDKEKKQNAEVEEEERRIERKAKQVYVGVINKAEYDFLKNKDKK